MASTTDGVRSNIGLAGWVLMVMGGIYFLLNGFPYAAAFYRNASNEKIIDAAKQEQKRIEGIIAPLNRRLTFLKLDASYGKPGYEAERDRLQSDIERNIKLYAAEENRQSVAESVSEKALEIMDKKRFKAGIGLAALVVGIIFIFTAKNTED
jgi:hypothetical protein